MSEPAQTAAQRGRRLEAWLVAALFVAVNLVSARWQAMISDRGGKVWESASYYQVAEEFSQGKPVVSEAPTVFRLGTPWLAAHVCPQDLIQGFRVVNLAANALGVALLVGWLRCQLGDWKIRVVLAGMYILQWDAPTRWVWFEPIHTDPWTWVFLLGGLIAVHRVGRGGPGAGWWLAALGAGSVVGVWFREITLLVPVTLLFARRPVTRVDGAWGTLRSVRWPPARFFLPLVLGLAGWWLVRRAVTVTNDFSFGWAVQHWAYTKPLPELAHAWLLAFGPLLFLALYDWRRAGAFLAANQDLLVYLAGFAVLGYVGGTDTERLTYWTMPVVYVLIGRALEAHWPLLRSAPLVALLAACQLISERALMLTPDYPNEHPDPSLPLFTPGLGHRFAYLDLFSFFGSRPVEVISLTEYLVFGVVLWEWLSYRRRKLAAVGE